MDLSETTYNSSTAPSGSGKWFIVLTDMEGYMSHRKLKDQFAETVERKMTDLRETRKWLATTKMTRLLDSLDYLADKHDAKVENFSDGVFTSAYLTLNGLDGLKDERLVALCNSLLHHEPIRITNDDDAINLTRQFHYRWVGPCGYSFAVHVVAIFKSDSATCHRVIVGYKEPSKEPSPIYKLQCEDVEQPVEQPQKGSVH